MGQPLNSQIVREERSRFLCSTFPQGVGESRALFQLCAETQLTNPRESSLTGNLVEKLRRVYSP